MSQVDGASMGRRGGQPFRVMIVDDSAVVRGLVTRFLEQDASIHVAASVGNGQRALDALSRAPVDVIVLDIEMPVMDGLTALPRLLEIQRDVQVVVSSTLTKSNAEISLRALRAGAAEYVTKPSSTGLHSAEDFQAELRRKVVALGTARRKATGEAMPEEGVAQPERAPAPRSTPTRPAPLAPLSLRPASGMSPPRALAIGSSTGGPQALFQVLGELGAVPQPILVTQHMPKTFTSLLADHIGRQTGLDCVEAREGDSLIGGRVHIAPGGFHLLARGNPGDVRLHLSEAPPENFCRPSVDPMLRSLIDVYGSRILVVILTGMGHDGLSGCEAVVAAGGQIIAQDEATSVVWGMPGAVARAGLCSAVLPLGEIAGHLRRIATRSAA